jgi:hypothetical protein
LEGYASEESSNEIVGVLQNDFCPNPDLDLGGEDNIEDCQNFMPLFIPDAMKQISQMVTEHSPVLCQNLFDVPCRVETVGEPRGYSNGARKGKLKIVKNQTKGFSKTKNCWGTPGFGVSRDLAGIYST